MRALLCAGALCLLTARIGGYSFQAAPEDDVRKSPVMQKLVSLAGGTWKSVGPIKTESKYEVLQGGKAVRSVGAIRIGTPNETPVEVRFGWDPTTKQVYYIDFHGHDSVYRGYVTLEPDGALLLDFRAIVGPAGHYRARQLIEGDKMSNSISVESNGKWEKLFTIESRKG